MVAIFVLECCHRELVHGRVRGDEMYPPGVVKCPFGCQRRFDLNGSPRLHGLRFVRYESEELLTEELRKTWQFPDRTSAKTAAAHLERSLVVWKPEAATERKKKEKKTA